MFLFHYFALQTLTFFYTHHTDHCCFIAFTALNAFMKKIQLEKPRAPGFLVAGVAALVGCHPVSLRKLLDVQPHFPCRP